MPVIFSSRYCMNGLMLIRNQLYFPIENEIRDGEDMNIYDITFLGHMCFDET